MENFQDNRKFIFPKKISGIYTYNYPLNSMFLILRDFDLMSDYFSDIRSKITFLNGKNTYTIGNKFSFNWYYQTNLNLTVKEVIDEDYYKRITWLIDADQWNISYYYTYTAQANTLHKSTILIWDIIYEDPFKLPFTKTTLKDYHRIMLESCKRFNLYIKDHFIDIDQTESLTINCERKLIWNNLINLNKLYQFNPNNNLIFEYEHDNLRENTLIKVKDVNNNSLGTFVVKNILEGIQEEIWSFELDLDKENNILPIQNIYFTIYELAENKNFLIIKHKFKNFIKMKHINELSEDKKQILINLKDYLEKI